MRDWTLSVFSTTKPMGLSALHGVAAGRAMTEKKSADDQIEIV
jgi:hypothetical protein